MEVTEIITETGKQCESCGGYYRQIFEVVYDRFDTPVYLCLSCLEELARQIGELIG